MSYGRVLLAASSSILVPHAKKRERTPDEGCGVLFLSRTFASIKLESCADDENVVVDEDRSSGQTIFKKYVYSKSDTRSKYLKLYTS